MTIAQYAVSAKGVIEMLCHWNNASQLLGA
mgnify:CR=1 FL=1